MRKGILYGVGVGPGDPELMTIKAQRLLQENSYIAYPGKIKEDTYAYKIVAAAVNDLSDKIFVDCYVKMTKDRDVLDRNYDIAADKIKAILEQGKNVVYITIGDPTVYATYMYVHKRVKDAGYETQIVPGVTSFCAAAARLNVSLGERNEQIHIIPSSYDIEDALRLPGNKILMKAAGRLSEVKERLKELDNKVYMVENCGMENERICYNAEEIDDTVGYLSVILVKE